jgi:hypothetical protein
MAKTTNTCIYCLGSKIDPSKIPILTKNDLVIGIEKDTGKTTALTRGTDPDVMFIGGPCPFCRKEKPSK